VKSYSEVNIFEPAHVSAFKLATTLVGAIPEPGPDEEPWRCHEVARVVARVLAGLGRFSVVDGWFGGCDHSWLVSHDGLVILDVYAVGGLPPVVLLDTGISGKALPLPYGERYERWPEPRNDIRWDVVERLATKLQGGK
jgi:hypothetical protein